MSVSLSLGGDIAPSDPTTTTNNNKSTYAIKQLTKGEIFYNNFREQVRIQTHT